MPPIRESMLGLVVRRREPAVVQAVRSTAAAVIAYVAAFWFTTNPQPLLAPLTALLVVQVTVYATLTSGFRRVVSVVAGVLLAVGFSSLVGLSWWSLGVLILASLTFGHMLRVDEFVAEVAISGMLVLGVQNISGEALDRVVETLVGAVVGVLLNVFVAPPVWVEPASAAVENQAERMRALLRRIGGELAEGADAGQAMAWLHEARRLDNDIGRVDAELARAEESTRLNPRVRGGVHARLVLRSGLDTLEICAVVLRTLCRSLVDLPQASPDSSQVYTGELAAGLHQLFIHLADGVHAFARLVSAQVMARAEHAEGELARALAAGRSDRGRIAALLHEQTQRQPEAWELHGALLANIDRLLNELDLEKRSRWLAAQMSRERQARPVPHAAVDRLRRQVRRRSRSA